MSRPTSGTSSTSNSLADRAIVGVLVVLGLLVTLALMSGGTSARVGPATVDLPAGRQTVATPLGESATTRLRVPSIDVDTGQLMTLDLNEDRTLQVPSDATTVGWYGRGASPGEKGSTVYASHVNYGGQEGGFARLSDVEAGDQVMVDRADDTTVVYSVDRIEQVSKDAFPTATVYGPTVSPALRMITCGGEFVSDVRSYEDNVVVFGTIVEAYRT